MNTTHSFRHITSRFHLRRKPSRIVIFGLAKSGTTALYYRILRAMPPDTRGIFEKPAYLPEPDDRQRPILAKSLLRRDIDVDSFATFKKIFLVRDPRDRMISEQLYLVFHQPFCTDDTFIRSFLQLLHKKENNPRSVPLLEICRLYHAYGLPLLRQPSHRCQSWMQFHRDQQKLTLRYEDVVDNRLHALERYLHMPLKNDVSLPGNLTRVIRTKAYGSWRHWFTPEDVAFFRPHFTPFMERYEYADEWELASQPIIRPEHSSHYITRLIDEARNTTPLPAFAYGYKPASHTAEVGSSP